MARIETTETMVVPSAVTTLKRFFTPSVIAVVGANRRRGAIGSEVFHNLSAGGFRGRVFAVNPHADTVDGATAWPTVAAIPAAVDLAVIAVPRGSRRWRHR